MISSDGNRFAARLSVSCASWCRFSSVRVLAWYIHPFGQSGTIFTMAVAIAIAGYAFRVSLATQPLFGAALLEEE